MKHFLIALLTLTFAAPALAATPPASFADMVEKASPAVVNISTSQKIVQQNVQMPGNPFGFPDDPQLAPFREFFEQFGGMPGMNGTQPEREVTSLGSGFIIDPSGFVVTNNHVIGDADQIHVILNNNTKLKAKLVGRDAKTDLAVLKVDPAKPLPALAFGDSDTARVGDWVVAIGNPFGLGGSVTAGIISARARNIHAGPFDDFIQTDAAINRGNSGGPLLNTNGEVIGITSAIFSPTGTNIGIGFAVPVSLAKPIIERLKKGEKIQRGWLGVKIEPVNEEVAESLGLKSEQGALILEVTDGSPADKAGIKPGDVILSFGGKDIQETRSLPRLVADTPVGSKVPVKLWRKGDTKTVTLAVGEMKDEERASTSERKPSPKRGDVASKDVLGMSLAELTDQLRTEFGYTDKAKGALVVNVTNGGIAAKRGIRPGDLIVQVNGNAVDAVEDVTAAVTAARKEGRNFVLLRLQRGGNTLLFLTVPVKE